MRKATTCLLLFLSMMSRAQDTLSVANDSLAAPIIIPGFYLDYGKLLFVAADIETRYEGGLEFIVKDKWQLIGEVGRSELTRRSAIENGEYLSKGNYFRFGLGWVPRRVATSRIGIGMRYAKSSFRDLGNYIIESPSGLQPDINQTFDRRNLSATWWEAVIYSDQAVNKWLTLGFQFRVRIMQEYDSFEGVDVVAIPGYGRAQDKSVPAVNLFLKITPF